MTEAPGQAETSPLHPSLAYARPERVLLAPSPNVADEQVGRFFCRERQSYYLIPQEAARLRETLRVATRLLNDPSNFPDSALPNWWIGVGTALGFAREKGFLRGDTDIDVRVGLEYISNRAAYDTARSIAKVFVRNGFELLREAYFDGRPMQAAFWHKSNGSVIFDIYYFYSGVSEGRYVNANHLSYRRKPKHLIDNKRTMSWPGYATLKVNVPYPVEDYLAWRFGPEWRTPKKTSELGPIDNACLERLPRVTVLTYGTWDLLHHGHRRLLDRAAQLGDQLVVGVVSDELCKIKGKHPMQNETVRAEALRSLPFVREVFIQRVLDQKEFDIERFGVAHLVVGDDWLNHPRFEQVRGYRGVELHYLPRTPGISSTEIRAGLAGKIAE